MTHLFLGMSSKAVFSLAFLVLVGVTLLVPGFPPAQMLPEYMKIQPTSLSIFGLSAASLLNGILNGFFWVLIGAAIYGVACYASAGGPSIVYASSRANACRSTHKQDTSLTHSFSYYGKRTIQKRTGHRND